MKQSLVSALVAVLLLSGCSSLMGSLRRDLDDSVPYEGPTVGGRFSEFGQLSGDDLEKNNPYGSLGHRERGLASDRVSGGGRGWASDHGGDGKGQDRTRSGEYTDEQEDATYSQNPNLVTEGMQRQYRSAGSRATRKDFQDDGVNEGSLWASDGQTNYYFTKNKIRGVGDLVTVKIEENLLKDLHREVRRTLSMREKEVELEAAQDRLNKKAQGIDEAPVAGATGAAAPAGAKKDQAASTQAAPARGEPVAARDATAADIDVGRSVDLATGDVVMAEILERFPNGNYKIRGTKKVNYRGSARMMSFVGIVRGSDIGEDDTVTSGKLYEYQLEVNR